MEPTPLQEPVADLGFLNGGGQVLKAQGSERRGGMGRGEAVPLPRNIF